MIAHLRKSDFKEQSVQDHSVNVSLFAKKFGEKAGFASMAELAGFLHDIGKHTQAFRVYLEKAVKGTEETLEKIDHSTAGAKYLYERYYNSNPTGRMDVLSNMVTEIIGMVILSHHSGLQNFIQVDGSQSDYFRRVCKEDLPYYEEVYSTFLSIPGNEQHVESLFQSSLKEMEIFLFRIQTLMKMEGNLDTISPFVLNSLAMKFIFSCLIDADRTDARRFDEGDTSDVHPCYQHFFKESYQQLMNQLDQWNSKDKETTPINRLRSEMSTQCDRLAEKSSSIYQLSIPTGGGKTLASLRYALKHAGLFNKDRIIYVVPYTTILEQNADAIRNVIQNEEMVLEHHANVMDEQSGDDRFDYYQREKQKKLQLARDNWDYPIIFTTMVQFLDVFYAKGTRKSRRLHNLANSIIIFDEVQSVPVKHIPLFNSAVNFLHYIANSSILLCTATQPTFSLNKGYPLIMKSDSEMVDNLSEVVEAFKRVRIENKVTKNGWSAEEIGQFVTEELTDIPSILVILNTKKAVLNLYQQLKDSPGCRVYHLSTSMCPQHRKDILKEVRERLEGLKKYPAQREKIICISTQLIEAGVDIDFHCVIRSLAGLDSIAQAAGRCNRNGNLEKGSVYIIRAKDENLTRLPEIALGQKVMEEDIFSRPELVEDLLAPQAIQTYFAFYLAKAEREIPHLDPKLNVALIELIDQCSKYYPAIPKNRPKTYMRSMFKSLEAHFQVIEAHTTGILVPYSERGKELIALLNEDIRDYDVFNRLLKEAQLFTVNVYSHTLRKLVEENLIYPLYQHEIYALQDSGYHEEYGLSIEAEGTFDLPIF